MTSKIKLSYSFILISLIGCTASILIDSDELRKSVKTFLFFLLIIGLIIWFSHMHKKYHYTQGKTNVMSGKDFSILKILLILMSAAMAALLLIEVSKVLLVFYEIV